MVGVYGCRRVFLSAHVGPLERVDYEWELFHHAVPACNLREGIMMRRRVWDPAVWGTRDASHIMS